jgi:AcrR family transcriptional regulator
MRDWIPVSSSPKGRLARRALEEFGGRRFDEVTVGEIAARAGVTTGPLYHHFGSKLGLYAFVRDEAERRLLDRMEGAVAARSDESPSGALRAALLIGFDFAVAQGFVRLLGEPHPARDVDPVADLLGRVGGVALTTIGRILAAAWREALLAVADGVRPTRARRTLEAIRVDEAILLRS